MSSKKKIIVPLMIIFLVLNFVVISKVYSHTFSTIPTASGNSVSASGNPAVSAAEPESAPPPVQLGCTEAKIYALDKYTIPLLSTNPVTWISSNEKVASIDNNGVVTTHKAGTATITAIDADGNSAECLLNVVKVAYLTVDDNPNPTWTPKLLEILDKYNIKATFFLCGSRESHDLYKRIYDEGHKLALHGYSHRINKIYASKKAFEDNIIAEEKFLKKVTGTDNIEQIVRFPTGSNGYKDIAKYMVSKGYHLFDWTTTFHDTYFKRPESSLEYLINHAGDDREIILMHHKEVSVLALEDAIKYFLDNGYEFAVITYETTPFNFAKQY